MRLHVSPKLKIQIGYADFYAKFYLILYPSLENSTTPIAIIPANLPGQFSFSGQIFLHWASATLKGHVEIQNIFSRPLFTIIFTPKIVISRIKILVQTLNEF